MPPKKVYTARAVPDPPQCLFNVTEELNFATEEEFNRVWSVSDNLIVGLQMVESTRRYLTTRF